MHEHRNAILVDEPNSGTERTRNVCGEQVGDRRDGQKIALRALRNVVVIRIITYTIV